MKALIIAENTRSVVRAVFRWGAVAVLGTFAACHGFSRPPSTRLDVPLPYVLTVHDTRQEDVYDPRTDSLVPHEYESIITYSGRIEDTGDGHATAYNDSIRFRGIAPFRLDAFMSGDTLYAVSMERQGAVQAESMELDKPMLGCLFAGPALSITFPEGGGPEHVEHMKTDCPGGIYKRLDLPRTLGFFVLRIPSGQRQTGGEWEEAESWPSYAGLGPLPELRLKYRISHLDKNEMTVEATCDTTLNNVDVVMPNGEKASIISNRIHVEGKLVTAVHSGLCRVGQAFITEEIRYVRGEISTTVLHKECQYRLTLNTP